MRSAPRPLRRAGLCLRTARLLLCATLAQAGLAHALDREAARVKAQVCFACHGEQGISALENTPSLAGQPDAFLQWQLVYFRSKTRKSEIMGPIAAGLKDADIRELGSYFAALVPPKGPDGPDPDPQLAAQGAKVAQANRCSVCHSENYLGQQAVARLALQREDYLYKALKDFREGRRTGGGVAAMPDAVYKLSDDDMKSIAHFLSRLAQP
ncbi:MAG: c-type cytochrome [Betaproteobacteria bacterium]